MVETIEWTAGGVVMIDQTRLPLHEEYVTCRNYEEVATAIRDMIIRGAPAIGVAAAMGVAIGVQHASEADLDAPGGRDLRDPGQDTADGGQSLLGHRPHEAPVRLRFAASRSGEIRERLIQEAQLVREEDIAINRAIRKSRRGAGSGPQDGAHPLQRRRARDGGIRYGAGRDPGGRESRAKQIDVFAG